MSKIYTKLQIDIQEPITDIVTAVQEDSNSRYLDVVLMEKGIPLNLSGEEVRIYMRKPDGTELFNDGEITSAAAGRCQFLLTTQALAMPGVLLTQISIWKDDREILSTNVFKIYVTKSLRTTGSIESSNEYGALVLLFQNLHEAYDLMTDMIEKIGVPGDVAQSLQLSTMFEVWDWLAGYLRENSSAAVVELVRQIIATLGNSPDTPQTTLFSEVKALRAAYEEGIMVYYPSNTERSILLNKKVNVPLTAIKNSSSSVSLKSCILNDPFICRRGGTVKVKITATVSKTASSSKSVYLVLNYAFNETREDGGYRPIHGSVADAMLPVGTVAEASMQIATNLAQLVQKDVGSTTSTLTFSLRVRKGDILIFTAFYNEDYSSIATAGSVSKIALCYDEK